MAVTDAHVAAIRALIDRDTDEHRRIWDKLEEREVRHGYLDLLSISFVNAAQKRFAGKNKTDIVEWVAEVRSERDPEGKVDPNAAEELLLWAFDRASADDMDSYTYYEHQAVLMVLMMDELELDEEALNAFMQKARRQADAVLEQLGEA